MKNIKINRIFRTAIILIIVLSNVSCDQISKNIVRKNIRYNEDISLINNHFLITKTENTGAFLSLGDQLPQSFKIIVFMILPLLFLFGILLYTIKNTKIKPLLWVGLCCMIGGGIGNIYDRIRYGSVTDFLYIDLKLFHTGIFNLADVSVMLGVGLILYSTLEKRLNFN